MPWDQNCYWLANAGGAEVEPTRKPKRCWELTIRGCHSCCLVFSADNVTLDHTSHKNAPSLSESWLAVATERHTCERRDPLEARLGIMGSYWNDLRRQQTTQRLVGWGMCCRKEQPLLAAVPASSVKLEYILHTRFIWPLTRGFQAPSNVVPKNSRGWSKWDAQLVCVVNWETMEKKRIELNEIYYWTDSIHYFFNPHFTTCDILFSIQFWSNQS